MFCNFNDVFNKPEPTELIADKSPCRTCEHRIKDVAVTDGYSDGECRHCGKKWSWIMDCIERLAWYEKKYGLPKQKKQCSHDCYYPMGECNICTPEEL